MNPTKLVSALLLCFISFGTVESFQCFECGYFELPDGDRVPIHEFWGGPVEFCDDFTANATITKEVLPVRYIYIYIYIYI